MASKFINILLTDSMHFIAANSRFPGNFNYPRGSVILASDVEAFRKAGISVHKYKKTITSTGRARYTRVETPAEKAARKQQSEQRWENKCESIPGRVPLPEHFDAKNIGNCGIVANAIASRTPINEVWEYFRNKCRNPSRWKGSTYSRDYSEFLSSRGVSFTKTYDYQGVSITRFIRQHSTRNVTYMITTRGHVVTVRNGYIIDQMGAIPYDVKSAGGKAKIMEVWVIKDQPTKIAA